MNPGYPLTIILMLLFPVRIFTKPTIFLLGTVKTSTCFMEWSGFYFGSQSRPVAVIGQFFFKKSDSAYNLQQRAENNWGQPLWTQHFLLKFNYSHMEFRKKRLFKCNTVFSSLALHIFTINCCFKIPLKICHHCFFLKYITFKIFLLPLA